MKRLFGVLSLLLLMTTYGFSQQADMIQRGQRGYVPPMQYNNSAYITIKDPVEETQLVLAKCEQEFALDAFQKEIMKNMLIKRFEDENAILKDEANTKESRRKKLDLREKQFFAELESILNQDQVERFKDMDFSETKSDKKKRKKKKRKRNKDSR